METHWVICPLCKAKTRLKLLPDTVLKNYPLFCPKCKKEVIINAIESLGKGASVRGEALTLEEFAELSNTISQKRNKM